MKHTKHIPGEIGVWVLVFIDLVVFGVLFLNYGWSRLQPDTGTQLALTGFDQDLGCLNTIVLLTSSWFVAMAMVAVREQRYPLARRYLLGALALGAVFVAVKAYEYFEKLSSGISPATNSYFAYFFTLTGLHLFHVLVGMGVLSWMRGRVATISEDKHVQYLESGATFWHMVDLLWIVIFPILYLM